MTAPPLKTDPKYGYFPHWPHDGNEWLHPEDIAIARSMIPSFRIFRREGFDGDYSVFHYGGIRLRARPALWQEVVSERIEIGDWVEVISRGMLNESYTGTIREIYWDENVRAIRYQISQAGQPVENMYAREDFQRVDPV